MRNKRRWRFALAMVALLVAAFLIYAEDYYRADETAKAALMSDDAVRVTRTAYGWLFDGPSEDCALVFYTGAKVEETAYAPLLHRLAREGVDACLVKMPLRLAFLAANRASEVMKCHDYAHWYVGGHSLGGLCAADYAAAHPDTVDGVVLCAAYPMKPLGSEQTEILLYGSEDRVLNRERLDSGRRYAPPQLIERVIEGGNHAQFGCYGPQRRDGTAAISSETQQEEAVRIIVEGLNAGRPVEPDRKLPDEQEEEK